MMAVGKDFILMRQISAAGIDKINARQAVCRRDILGAQMLFHRHRIVGAAFDRCVIDDQHAVAPRYAPDSGDNPGRRHVTAIEPVRRQSRKLEKVRAGIDQRLNALARQQFSALDMARARFVATAIMDFGKHRIEPVHQGLHDPGIFAELG